MNCHRAFEIGLELADSINDITFADVKLKRDSVVEINPELLFHRICWVIESRDEMEEYLKYEINPTASFSV